MLNVIMFNVIMVSVVAPKLEFICQKQHKLCQKGFMKLVTVGQTIFFFFDQYVTDCITAIVDVSLFAQL
jgi:hypothetical protein